MNRTSIALIAILSGMLPAFAQTSEEPDRKPPETRERLARHSIDAHRAALASLDPAVRARAEIAVLPHGFAAVPALQELSRSADRLEAATAERLLRWLEPRFMELRRYPVAGRFGLGHKGDKILIVTGRTGCVLENVDQGTRDWEADLSKWFDPPVDRRRWLRAEGFAPENCYPVFTFNDVSVLMGMWDATIWEVRVSDGELVRTVLRDDPRNRRPRRTHPSRYVTPVRYGGYLATDREGVRIIPQSMDEESLLTASAGSGFKDRSFAGVLALANRLWSCQIEGESSRLWTYDPLTWKLASKGRIEGEILEGMTTDTHESRVFSALRGESCLLVLDATSQEVVERAAVQTTVITIAKGSAGAPWIATGDAEGTVRIFLSASLDRLATLEVGAPVKDIQFSDDGATMAIHAGDEIRVFRLKAPKPK